MNTALWIAQGLLAFVFLMGGITLYLKLNSPDPILEPLTKNKSCYNIRILADTNI